MLRVFRTLIRDLRSIACKCIEVRIVQRCLHMTSKIECYEAQKLIKNASLEDKDAREYSLQSLYVYTVSFVWINSLAFNYIIINYYIHIYERLAIESIYLNTSYYCMKNKINQFNFRVSVYHNMEVGNSTLRGE